MKLGKTLIVAALPLALAVGCETANQGKSGSSDKAAMQAQSDAKRAAAAANAAAASAAGTLFMKILRTHCAHFHATHLGPSRNT